MIRVTPRARTWPANAASGSAAPSSKNAPQVGSAPRLDDEVPVEKAVRHRAVGSQAGAPAVVGAEMLQGGRHRDDLEHRRRYEQAAGVQLVDDLELAAVDHPRGEVAAERAVRGPGRRLRLGRAEWWQCGKRRAEQQ